MVIGELKRLTKVIPGILDFSIGANNSLEGLAGRHTRGNAEAALRVPAASRYQAHRVAPPQPSRTGWDHVAQIQRPEGPRQTGALYIKLPPCRAAN